MAEYIKREDAYNAACDECEAGTFYDIPSKIMALPSADVVPRKDYESMERTVHKLNKALAERKLGKWSGIPKLKTAKCPLCGKETDILIYNDGVLEGCRYCGVRPPIQTNADRIRSMSDEELANFLCYLQIAYDLQNPLMMLEWLMKEVEDG